MIAVISNSAGQLLLLMLTDMLEAVYACGWIRHATGICPPGILMIRSVLVFRHNNQDILLQIIQQPFRGTAEDTVIKAALGR